MKSLIPLSLTASASLLIVSCMAPPVQSGNAGGTYQDPNNPYAVPGVSTEGSMAPASQAPYQAPTASAPYQPIPSVSPNPPASIPTYTPPTTNTPVPASGGGGSHTVVGGDTLWGLSRKYGVSVDSIRQANGLTSDTIVTGQTLSIPQ